MKITRYLVLKWSKASKDDIFCESCLFESKEKAEFFYQRGYNSEYKIIKISFNQKK